MRCHDNPQHKWLLHVPGQNVTMPADPISPIAPARVRAILLPVGRIKKPRFESFAERLRPEYIVRLGDISQDVRPDRGRILICVPLEAGVSTNVLVSYVFAFGFP